MSKQNDTSNDTSMEQRILAAMKVTLVNIIKDTTVEPGLRHPLSDNTIEDIRHCLSLITVRENELAKKQGTPTKMRPRYTDEPEENVVVSLTTPKKD